MKKLILMLVLLMLPVTASSAEKESAYERVLRTGILRCGYGSWDPAVIKDTDGKMSGFFVQMMEETARMSGIKVEWTAEIDWGQIPEALKSGKVDAFCSAMANDGARAKRLAYTIPVSYWSFDVVTRADDARFPSNRPLTVADINKAEYSTAYSEGDVLETIKNTELPNVKGVALPPLGTPADNIMSVLSKKTDFVVFPRVMIQNYEKKNGTGKLRLLKMKTPLRVFGNVVAVDISEQELVSFLNAALIEFINSSAYDRIMDPIAKEYPGAFLKPKAGYELPK